MNLKKYSLSIGWIITTFFVLMAIMLVTTLVVFLFNSSGNHTVNLSLLGLPIMSLVSTERSFEFEIKYGFYVLPLLCMLLASAATVLLNRWQKTHKI